MPPKTRNAKGKNSNTTTNNTSKRGEVKEEKKKKSSGKALLTSKAKNLLEKKKSPLEEARELLHTFHLPNILLHRENECAAISKFIKDGIKTNCAISSRVLCISGVPGTGKTASVLKAVSELEKKCKFSFENINGLELSDPRELFIRLFRQVFRGETGAMRKISKSEAQQRVDEYFLNAKRKKAIVLLIDEIDMLHTKREDVIYALFNWASDAKSRFCVIAISNTLDLAERQFSQRIVSRMGNFRLTFQPYGFKEIEEILKERVKRCLSVDDASIELASKKIASFSGDLRKAFELMRRAIDLALEQCEERDTNRNDARLTSGHVADAIKESVASIRLQFLHSLSTHELLLFRALVNELNSTALEDTDFSPVLARYKKICISDDLLPLPLEAAFYHLRELASFHYVVISSNNVKLHCRLKLGFPVSEAQFCLRQFDGATRSKPLKSTQNFNT